MLPRRRILHSLVSLPLRRTASSATGDELQAARAWLANLDAETIPLQSIGELSFSRSSGPGGQNVNNCYKRLYKAIAQAGHDAVAAETPAAQMQRVKHLQKSDNERRLKSKKQQSAKKTSRRGRGDE